MIKYSFYIAYNLIYQVLSFCFFVYANTYINEAFVPDSFIWENNQRRIDKAGLAGAAIFQTLILLIEAAILILLIYFINKLFLNYTFGKNTNNKILIWTIRINIILSICFIAFLMWGSFKGYLW
jgi:hypothetical protein